MIKTKLTLTEIYTDKPERDTETEAFRQTDIDIDIDFRQIDM